LSNPSMNPLPDVIGRRKNHVYSFEWKNGSYAVTIPKEQIVKLFACMHEKTPNTNDSSF